MICFIMKKIFFLLFAVFCINSTVSAQSASISNISLEHNVMYSGLKCMAVHLECSVDNMQHKTVNFCVYFFDANGNPIMAGYNPQFRSANGQLCVGTNSYIKYENAYWNDCVIYVPYNIFPFAGSYQCKAQIAHSSYGVLALSDTAYFNFYR